MATTNPITGDAIKTKTGNQDAYATGWDLIFGKKFGEKVPVPEDNQDGSSTIKTTRETTCF